jgi:murein DD-endopeptidase MepM/ murein hydrolase activator NlpD
VIDLRSFLARGQGISVAAVELAAIKRKTLPGAAASAALWLGAAAVPGVPEAMGAPMAAGYNASSAARDFALEMTSPRAQPGAPFDAIWPALPGNDTNTGDAMLQLMAAPPDTHMLAVPAWSTGSLHVTLPSNGAILAPMCAASPGLCMPADVATVSELAAGAGVDAGADSGADAGADFGADALAHAWSGRVTTQDDAGSSLEGASAFGLPGATVLSGAGSIDGSLRATLMQAGFAADVVAQIERIFAGRLDVDGAAREGDGFRIVIDSSAAQEDATPRIASVEIRLNGRSYDALWFVAPGASSGEYYTFDGALLADALFAMPLNYRRVSSPFGMRVHPVFGEPRFHKGVDLTAPVGTPVYAAAGGTVESVRAERGYGKHVVVRHADGFTTSYAHLSMFARGLRVGERVGQGQVIGMVGRTGTTTGPHLHFEVRLNDRPIDPLTLTAHQFVAPLSGAVRLAFDAAVGVSRQRLADLPRGRVAMG